MADRLTAKAILRRIGNDKLSLHRDQADYWYFIYDDQSINVFETHSVLVPRLSDLSMDYWVDTGTAFIEQVRAEAAERGA